MTAPLAATSTGRPVRIWPVWLALCAFLLVMAWPSIATFDASDPDDDMRLLQVRDWLDGQGWYDTRQYRLNPPFGADMHWVRLADLPLAAALWVARLFADGRTAETLAMVAVPLLQLLAGMALLRAVVRQIGGDSIAQHAALLLVPAFPLLATNFMPLRIDHHGWQSLAALAVCWAMLRDTWRHALVAGLIAAAWLTISLEGIALCAAFGAVFAWRWWRAGARQHEAFLLGLGIGLPLLFAIFRPLRELPVALCDLPTWPHFLAFAGAALAALAARAMPLQDPAGGRLLSLVPVGAIAAAALFVPLGWCVVSPLSLDPFLQANWFDQMAESASIAGQSLSGAAMTLWTLALAGVAGWSAVSHAADPRTRAARLEMTAMALAAGLFSLLIMRAGQTAQLLTLPLAALLIARWWPRARAVPGMLPRIAATLALLALATPMLASSLTKPVDREQIYSASRPTGTAAGSTCDYDTLNRLPRAHLFATLDIGPEILARTPHTAIMSGYHRNQAKMIETILGFTESPDKARRIIAANRADYLVACLSSGDLQVATQAGPDSLADRIVGGTVPAWLQPVPGFDGGLRVYRVLPQL